MRLGWKPYLGTAGFLAIAYFLWGGFIPYDLRTKLTVKVRYQGEVYEASTVQQLTIQRGGDLISEGINVRGRKGDAAVIEFLDGSGIAVLFEDHRGTGSSHIGAILSCSPGSSTPSSFLPRAKAFEGPCELPARSVPMTVYIPDIETPESIKPIWRNEETTSLGVELLSATLERTSEPVASDARRIIPWLGSNFPYGGIPIRHDRGGTYRLGLYQFTYGTSK